MAFKKWNENGKKDKNCFLSWSSMAPVLAGFVALILEIDSSLSKKQILKLLNNGLDNNSRIIDIYNTIILLKNSNISQEKNMEKIFVCAGSKLAKNENIVNQAKRLGKLLAESGAEYIQGGMSQGLMGLSRKINKKELNYNF